MNSQLIKNAIIKTLAYADIFSYPLKREEIWRWLIWENKERITKNDFNITLNYFRKKPVNNYYYLSDIKIIKRRKAREKASSIKISIALEAAALLKIIPFVKLIGISGALAMHNAGNNDDIDLFIICRKNTVWITRFLATSVLDYKKIRRRPLTSNVKNKICLNMYLDEHNLQTPLNEQNLYLAHEICQMNPLYDKDNTHQKFLSANSWVKNYLPNALEKNSFNYKKVNSGVLNKILNTHVPAEVLTKAGYSILNFILMLLQLLYMQKRRSIEILTPGLIKFHPEEKSTAILKKYAHKVKNFTGNGML